MLQAISDYEARAHGLRYDPEEIILTIGATEGLFIGLSTILNPGDEVIIPTPAFGLYESITRLLRGVPVSLPTEKNHFQIDPEALRAVITPKTKAIVLTSPNNPTGCIYTEETLNAVTKCSRTSRFSCSATMCTGSWYIRTATTALPSFRTCGTESS